VVESRGCRSAFALAFDDAQVDGLGRQIRDEITGLPALGGAHEEVQAAVDPLQRERREGLGQVLSERIGQSDQHGLEQPGGPQLEVHPVLRADPEVGHAQEPLDPVVAVFDSLSANDKTAGAGRRAR
jgi:hypothetical protein